MELVGKTIITLFSALILAMSALGGTVVAVEGLEGFEVAAENDYLALYLNERTVEFAVLQKSSGEVWYSNPYDRARKETVAGGSGKAMLNSQLTITFYEANRQLRMDSYNDSVQYDQYEIHPIPHGFRIDYDIGRKWRDRDFLPTVISEERFNDLILSRIENARDRKFVEDQFARFQLEKGYVDSDTISIHGVNLDELLGDYGLKTTGLTRATDKRRVLQEFLNQVRDSKKYDSLGQIKPEDLSGVYDTPSLILRWDIKQWDRDDLIDLIRDAGYTPDDAAHDHESMGIEPPHPDLRNFKISVEYVLDGDTFVARILGDSIVYPKDVFDPQTDKLVSYPLATISLLNYFGAADSEADGYMFVPDGSGALIRLNNGKQSATPYTSRLYGRDYASAPIAEYSPDDLQQIYFPVFGLKEGDRAYLAMVEDGDGMARLEAMVAGMRDSFNHVWTTFDYIPRVRVSLEAEGALIGLRQLSLNMYQSRPYRGDMSVRYTFLTGEDANYSGMARSYQNYLVGRKDMQPLDVHARDEMPIMLNVIGAIDRIQPVMGIPSNVVESLTTYEQAQLIVEDLLDSGVGGIDLRFKGWLKGGMNHVYPSKVRLEKKVGSSAALKNLGAFLAEKGIELFPEVSFALVLRDKMTDGFVGFLHASRSLNRSQAYMNVHNIATYQAISERRLPLLSPSRYSTVMSSFSQSYSQFDISGLSLGDMGRLLYSDFRLNPRKLIDRQDALSRIVEQAKRLHSEGFRMTVDGGNAYLLPYATYVTNAPLTSRGVEIIDAAVPFHSMVLSGYVPHVAPAANLSHWTGRAYLLKLLETGSLPSYTVSYADSSRVKHTDFDDMYSIAYGDLKDEIVELYEEASAILQDLWHVRITGHDCVKTGVCATEYEDGTIIIVNYNREPEVVGDIMVPAEDYVIVSGRKEGADLAF